MLHGWNCGRRWLKREKLIDNTNDMRIKGGEKMRWKCVIRESKRLNIIKNRTIKTI